MNFNNKAIMYALIISMSVTNLSADIDNQKSIFNEKINKNKIDYLKLVYPDKIKTDEIAQSACNNHEEVIKVLKQEYKGPIPSRINMIAGYFANYDRCVANKVFIQNSLLLHGKPGMGKKHLVKSLSKSLQIPYFYVSAPLFLDDRKESSLDKIRKSFNAAKDFNKPVIFFIDKIDCLANEEGRSTLSFLLMELENLQKVPNIFVIASADDKKVFSEAVLSKFSSSICELKPLDQKDKAELLEKFCKENNVPNYEGYPEALSHVLSSDDFYNEDLLSIVRKAKIRHYIACRRDISKCKEPMHKFFKIAIDETGKKAKYSWNSSFGSGI